EEYVLGAAERMIKSGSAGTRKPAAEAAPAPVPTAPGVGTPSTRPGLPLRWVLIGAGGLTAAFLVVAVVLALGRRTPPPPAPEVAKRASPVEKPLLPPPGSAAKEAQAAGDVPVDPGRAGEAVSRWERQADARPRSSARDHTEEIDSILDEHVRGGTRED